MSVVSIGLDLAKSVFQVHGVDASGHAALRRKLARSELLAFFAKQPHCLVGMEACSSAHDWARELVRLGHEVRLIPPQYVKPYVKRNKTDAADAEAICEAVGRPNMRFVPIKTREQQSILVVHRVRALLVRQRTASVNAARGLLGEFGCVVSKGIRKVDELRGAWISWNQSCCQTRRGWRSAACSTTSMGWSSASRLSKDVSSSGISPTRSARDLHPRRVSVP
jgi:transposase